MYRIIIAVVIVIAVAIDASAKGCCGCPRQQGFGERRSILRAAIASFQKTTARSSSPVTKRIAIKHVVPNHQPQNDAKQQFQGIRHDHQHQ